MRKVLIIAALLVSGIVLAQSPNPGPEGATSATMDLLYCQLNGCDMAGDIDMNGGRITDSTGPLNLGTAAASTHGLGVGSVIVGSQLEVRQESFFEKNLTLDSNRAIILGPGGGLLELDTGQTNNAVQFAAANGSETILIVSYSQSGVNYGHTNQTDPTLFIHSASSNTTHWGAMAHDQTNFVLSTGTGVISLAPATKGVELPKIEDASPSAPVTCNATNTGVTVYVDDNDDTATAELCICVNTNDSTYDWRQVGPGFGTACTFF